MRILVLSNRQSGTARRRARCDRFEARLRTEGARVDSEAPATASGLRERAAEASLRHHDLVIVAGGDGTVHEAVNGLVRVPRTERPPLLVLPVGRGNDFAAELGIASVEDAFRALEVGRRRRLDLGRAEASVFLSVAGTGFDARVARRARTTPLLSGSALYTFALLRTLVDFEPVEMRVRFDEGTYEGPLVFAAVGNASRYGGGMRITPEARMDDGHLDLCLVEPISRLTLVTVFPRVFAGTHLEHPKVKHRRSRSVEIETREPAEVFADGEFLQPTPIRIETLPAELEVLVPS